MAIQVQLLPSSAHSGSQAQPLTTFLINDRIAIDAGSLGFALDVHQLKSIEHIILTHSHLDHTVSLPIAVAEAYGALTKPLRVYGLASVLDVVRRHLFNDEVWVDFSHLPLMNGEGMAVEFEPFEPRVPMFFGDLKFTPIPVAHTVPTVGLIVEDGHTSVVFTSDTCRTDEIWVEANKLENLQAVFIECSFPDELEELAIASGHLTPRLVLEQISKLNVTPDILCVHLKPSQRMELLQQLRPLNARHVAPAQIGKVYRWGKDERDVD